MGTLEGRIVDGAKADLDDGPHGRGEEVPPAHLAVGGGNRGVDVGAVGAGLRLPHDEAGKEDKFNGPLDPVAPVGALGGERPYLDVGERPDPEVDGGVARVGLL